MNENRIVNNNNNDAYWNTFALQWIVNNGRTVLMCRQVYNKNYTTRPVIGT